MENTRRGFFSALAAVTGATAVANVPEPEAVQAVECEKGEDFFVLSFTERLSDLGVQRIRECWRDALGDNAPKLLILDGGVTLQRTKLPKS